jgi:hypothetical protein
VEGEGISLSCIFIAGLFSPDTGKYGDQIAIRDRYKHRGEDCVFVFLSEFR